MANGASIPGGLNLIRAMSTEGAGRIRYYSRVRAHLEGQNGFRAYFEQESAHLPEFYISQMRRDLGSFWQWLPESAIFHDPYAYLKTECAPRQIIPLHEVRTRALTASAVAPVGALPDHRDQKT
jgi:hypothetical protein